MLGSVLPVRLDAVLGALTSEELEQLATAIVTELAAAAHDRPTPPTTERGT